MYKVCLLVILHHYNLWLSHLEIKSTDGYSATWFHSASLIHRWRHLSSCIIRAACDPSDNGIDRPREDLFLCINVVYRPKSYNKFPQTTILISVFELLNFHIAYLHMVVWQAGYIRGLHGEAQGQVLYSRHYPVFVNEIITNCNDFI